MEEEVTDPTTKRMQEETGHSCPACPSSVRDLYATAYNLLVRLDSKSWSEVPRKAESLRRSLEVMEQIVDKHFNTLGTWRRP